MSEKPEEFDFNNYDEFTEEELLTIANSIEDIADFLVDTVLDLTAGVYILIKKGMINLVNNVKKMIGDFDELED